jgi:hypothetical protein
VADAHRLLEAIEQTVAFEKTIKAEIATGALQQSWLTRTLTPHGLL